MAAKTFTVSHHGIRIKVRVLPPVRDVHRAFGDKRDLRPMRGGLVNAYFDPMQSAKAKHVGTIVLPLDGKLQELIPHEVTHAVLHKARAVAAVDDEGFATAVGLLSARIHRHIEQIGGAA